MATINTILWSSSPATSGISFTGGNLAGESKKFIRVKGDESGMEFASLSDENFDVQSLGIVDTTPSDERVDLLFYGNTFAIIPNTTPGNGMFLSPTGELSAPSAYFGGGRFRANGTGIGFFGTTPIARKTVSGSGLSTTVTNPVLNTTTFISQMNTLLSSYRSLLSALGDVSGYGLIDSDI